MTIANRQLIRFTYNSFQIITLLVLSIAFISCDFYSSDIKRKGSQPDNTFSKTVTTKKNLDNTDREFKSFFKKFNSERDFQLSRISFPLKVNSYDDDGQHIEHIEKNEWEYTDLTRIKNIQIENKSISKNSVDVILSIIDTGIHTTYHFKVLTGKWQLTGITDESD